VNGLATPYQRTADRNRRDELILQNLPLVKHVIGRLIAELPPGVDIENLEAAGVLGLVEAAANYDPTRGAAFKSFAYLRVRGAVLDELRRNCPLPQQMIERVTKVRKAYRTLAPPVTVEALADATGLPADEVIDALAAIRLTKMVSWEQTALPNGLGLLRETEPPEAELERAERADELADAIRALPPRSQAVVALYYRDDLRLKEISQVLGLSESRLSRILSAAMFELGETLRARERRAETGYRYPGAACGLATSP
jgi:RNA polymerase sigma factor for flagellar operon FliA